MSNNQDLTFIEHLVELRSCIIKCLLTIACLAVFSYAFTDAIISFLILPARGQISKFYFFAPQDAFLIKIKLAFFSGLFFSLPVLFYQGWLFAKPGLLEKEKGRLVLFTLMASSLFLAGASFSFFLVLPVSLQFLMSFQDAFLTQMISFDKYAGFAVMMIFAFGLIFLLPILVYLLSIFNIVNAGALAVKRGYVLIVIFIVAALITPPDVLTQLILALPMYLLFEISVFVVREIEKKRNIKPSPVRRDV